MQWDNSTETIQFERLTFPDQELPKLIGGVYDIDDDANAKLKRSLLNQIGTRARLGSNLPNISGDSAGMYLMTIGGLIQSLGLTATFEDAGEGLSFTEDPDHPTYVGLKDDAGQMFGKIMSLSDELMWRYIDLLTFKSDSEKKKLKQSVLEGQNPKNIKIELASDIVERFYDRGTALKVARDFEVQT